MEIRAATFDDVDAIRDLMVASMLSLGPGFYTAEQTAAAARYLTVPDLELIEDGTLYVAVFSADQLEGPPILSSLQKQTSPESPPPSTWGEASLHPSADPPPHRPLQGYWRFEQVPRGDEEGRKHIVGVGGWSSRRKLFTGSAEQEGLVGRLDPLKDAARIRAFFVDPAFARQGIGRKLYEKCAAEARAAGFRSFSLMATLPGVPLYRALGFGDERPTDVRLPDGSELPCVEMGRRL